MASPAKKLKVGEKEDEQMATDAVVEISEPEELEKDMKTNSSPSKIKDPVMYLTQDTTMNIMPCTHGNMLVSLSDGGFQYLVAGARANAGIKSGRYMFEAKIVEQTNPSDGPKSNVLQARNMFRIGFSTDSASLFPGEDTNSICFDSEGFLIHNRTKTLRATKFGQDVMVAVVLNLEKGHPNCNTISLFSNGVRASPPQPLPESLIGQILYPAISFRNAIVHTNFGAPVAPLPFTCRTLEGASTTEVQVKKHTESADCKYNVVLPVALPEEGGFDWVDDFLAKNPDYVELSDRSIVAWAAASGIAGAQAAPAQKSAKSHDRLEVPFGAPSLDDGSFAKMLLQVATLQPRNYVVMELRGNLLQEGRAATLEIFKSASFEIKAEVIVGDPPPAFQKIVRDITLKTKQAVMDVAFKVKKAEDKKMYHLNRTKRLAEKVRLKLEKEKKLKAQTLKNKFDREKLIKEGKEVPPELQEKPEDDNADSEDGMDLAPLGPEPVDEDPPPVTLTDEEMNRRFVKRSIPDITEFALSTSFMKFSLPSSAEGFDDIRYSWLKQYPAAEYVKTWVSEKKSNIRVEDITPSAEFRQRYEAWKTVLKSWKDKLNAYKASYAKSSAAKAGAKIAQALAEKKKLAAALAEGKNDEELLVEGKKEDEEANGSSPGEFEILDIFGVSDVCDVGSGIPLFKDFGIEDFVMLNLRVELHLLAHGFVRDVDDPDRKGIKVDHLAFYYNKYYGRTLNCKSFGAETVKDLLAMVEDTLWVNKMDIIEPIVPWDLENSNVFIKIVEEARRHRSLRLELGEESAKLKVVVAPEKQEKPVPQGAGAYRDRVAGSHRAQNQEEGGWAQGTWTKSWY